MSGAVALTDLTKLSKLTNWIRRTAAAAKQLIVPVSGGSDSALCFLICQQALPGKVLGVFSGTVLRGEDWFHALGPIIKIADRGRGPEAEIRRWAEFLSLSNRSSGWLVGSRNRTEDLLGSYSLASRVASLLPLAGTWKSEVLALCRTGGVPPEIIDSSLQADPDCGRPSELAAIPYEFIEEYLRTKTGQASTWLYDCLSHQEIAYLDGIYRANEFKRRLPLHGPEFIPG